jgi:integrase
LGPSTKGLVVQVLKAAFNWAVAEDYLPESPLKNVKRRKIARRERVLSADERRALLDGAAGEFKDYLTVLADTGMRPFSETAKLRAAAIDWMWWTPLSRPKSGDPSLLFRQAVLAPTPCTSAGVLYPSVWCNRASL